MSVTDPTRRGTIVLGLALVILGGLALLGRVFSIDLLGLGWPIFVLAPGIALFAAGLAVGGRAGVGLAIPGGIVSMVGVVLSFQAATGLYATWAYAWALVAPGGVGVALVLYGLLTGQGDLVRNGVPVLLTGLGLFVAFGLFFEAVLHLSGDALPLGEQILAGGLVVLGAAILLHGRPRAAGPDVTIGRRTWTVSRPRAPGSERTRAASGPRPRRPPRRPGARRRPARRCSAGRRRDPTRCCRRSCT